MAKKKAAKKKAAKKKSVAKKPAKKKPAGNKPTKRKAAKKKTAGKKPAKKKAVKGKTARSVKKRSVKQKSVKKTPSTPANSSGAKTDDDSAKTQSRDQTPTTSLPDQPASIESAPHDPVAFDPATQRFSPLESVAADRESVPPIYQLQEDPLDPGFQIVSTIIHEMKQRIRSAAEDARQTAWVELLRFLVPPRDAVAATTLVQWSGREGVKVPDDLQLTSQDGRVAESLDPGFRLSKPVCILGKVDQSGEPVKVDVTALVCPAEDDESGNVNEFTSSDGAESFSELRIEMPPPSEISEKCGLPGIAWNVSPALSRKVRSIHLEFGGQVTDLNWEYDVAGRIVIPPQIVPSSHAPNTSTAGVAIVFEVAIGPGELRHGGRIHFNISRVREVNGESRDLPAGTFEMMSNRSSGLSVCQPFDGDGGREKENFDSWQRRAIESFRHRGRAVCNQDFKDILAAEIPQARLVDIAPTRTRDGNRYRDAVRLTLVPLNWKTLQEFFDHALLLASRTERLLADNATVGVRVITGPPSVVGVPVPVPSDPLWLYREFIVRTEDAKQSICRSDGVFWPVFRMADLESLS